MTGEKEVISIDEVAQRLGISRNLAYNLARKKEIPGVLHLGKKRMVVSRSIFERWLKER